PVRPAGFCNVNQLFEINTEQAAQLEVQRGPGTALHGSNALHGLINVIHGDPLTTRTNSASIEAGSYDYYRLKFDAGRSRDNRGYRVFGHITDDGGFREAAGFEQQKLNASYANAAGGIRLDFAATNLDQETAGFIFGEDAYKSARLRRENFNPEAFRKADSQRISAHWSESFSPAVSYDIRTFLRRSRMEFLQHFLPGQPLEENGHESAGLMFNLDWHASAKTSLAGGIDLEFADIFLKEAQENPITDGSDFLRETRPAGDHYDYTVDIQVISPFIQLTHRVTDRFVLLAGGRFESLRYEYDNNLLDGNTRDDGTSCGFGGCLFNRPADRDDRFNNFAPKFGGIYSFNPSTQLYFNLSRGFRAPQATELYRLQRGQDVADLDSETLDNLEFGYRTNRDRYALDVAGFYMKKDNFIFRDADGFNVSDGRTKHRGIEFGVDFFPAQNINLSVNGSYAKHTYDFNRNAALGESIEAGNDVDTAPRWLGSAAVGWRYAAAGRLEWEWVYLDEYFLNAANTATYEGHTLLNFRIAHDLNNTWRLSGRVNNVTNQAYAERADFAFGNFRYFPGRERSLFVELSAVF
ncbi:MAG: TonB-dependent receptor, partial [Gammaproteobacteria bacterium]|nr:TonB-dependent receptor [Gammaproteobacteria bacterium]